MKPVFLLSAALFSLSANAQTLFPFGVPNKNDFCSKLIKTADGSHLVAGIVDNDAAIYKFSCQGQLIDSIRGDLSIANSFEGFSDLLELPGGDILAVGHAKAVTPPVNHSLLVRLDAELNIVAFDTLKINGKTGEARAIVRSNLTGEVFVAGLIAGPGLDFADGYWQQIDPTTLQPIGPATTFSYGVDNIFRVNQTADGHFLIAGYAVLGNIFLADADLTNRAFCRKIKADGSLVWDYKVEQVLKNKFGRTGFVDATENPLTGNIFLAGQTATGDTLTNTLDASFKLLSPDGLELSAATFDRIGAQHLYQTQLAGDVPGFFISIGDSTDLSGNGSPVFLSTAVFEFGDQLVPADLNTNHDLTNLSPRSFLYLPGGRFQMAGIWHNPAGGVNNHDLFFANTEMFTVQIEANGPQLEAQPSQPLGQTYQWFFQNQPVGGATDSIFTATQNGEYQVVATNLSGCTASATINFSVGSGPDPELFFLPNDTICINLPLTPFAIINDAGNYQWMFGDLSVSTLKTPSHVYVDTGSYSISLCVTTKPTQKIATKITVLAHESPSPGEPLDAIADQYFILKNAAGQEIYRSISLVNQVVPFDIPCAILLENQTYLFELWDYDFFGTDDDLGKVFMVNPAAGGTFTFGGLTISFTTEQAQSNYCFERTIHVIESPKPTISINGNQLTAQPGGPGFTYTWFKNGQLIIPGGNTQTIQLNGDGQYSVQVFDGFCTTFSDEIVVMISANEPAWLAGIQLSPNPTDGPISLIFTEKLDENARLTVVNSLGQVIQKFGIGGRSTVELDFSDEKTGVYQLLFETEKSVGAKRMVVYR